MAVENLDGLESFLQQCVDRLSPAERVKLGRRIGNELQKTNATRIRENVDPEGNEFAPRKSPRRLRGRGRRGIRSRRKSGPMFLRAKAKKYLRVTATAGETRVGYVGAMARIMSVHQEGLYDHVTRNPNSPIVKYDARRVLGFAAEDRLKVLEIVAAQLGG
jgi:phage virion morphogenesis protein